MTQLAARVLGLLCLVLCIGSLFSSLHGCSAPEGVATRTEVLDRCAATGFDEDVVESFIIVVESYRLEGLPKGDALSQSVQACTAHIDPGGCSNCLVSIVDLVYD